MQSSSPGFQVQFTVTIPIIEPQALQFDSDVESGADRIELGRGGFGIVYAGRYQGKPVAIKTLHVTTASIVEALHKEAAMMFRIASPYTVKLQGICSTPKVTSLVVEHMTGGSLFDLLQDKSQELPWVLRYRLAYEIAEGLWALHSQEIIHRDLKSLNVLLDGEQHAKITDFGFSRLRGQITSVAASSKRSLGTPAYKSPELVEQDLADSDSDSNNDKEKATNIKDAKHLSPYSPYSDVYAYGVILWEIATRKIPFDGVSQRRIEKKIQSGKHEKIPADCPPEFAELIKACLAMKPGKRPKTDNIVARTKTLYQASLKAERVIVNDGGEGREEKEDAFTAPWHIDPRTKQAAIQLLKERALDKANPNPNKHVLLPGNEKDMEIVVASYEKAPVPGYTLKSVKMMYNPLLNQSFDHALGLLSARHQNPTFAPAWRKEQGEVAEWRNTTHQILERMAAPYKDPNHPHLNLLPMWHATDAAILPSLFETGFATLGLVDAGYFGRGIYSAGEARYSYSVYGKMVEGKGKEAALLMNWVASYSAYPVIDADGTNREMQSLEGKGNHANHDAHFVPVRPNNPKNPKESVFFPCQPGQAYTYTELVVFDKAHCLPRYVVELQSDLLKTPQEREEAKLKHEVEQAQKAKAKQQAEAAKEEFLAQKAAEQAQKRVESLEKEKEKERIKAKQIEAEKTAAVKQAVEAAKKEAERETAQQRQELQILKEKLAQVEAEEAKKVEEAEKRRAAEERKDDEDKTERQVKVYSPIWQPAFSKFWKPKAQTLPQVAQFLRLVTEGEQDKAEAMLKANPNLILQSGTVTDLSQRTFEHITAFQYAVWARDWHMWTMLLKYLPQEEAILQLHSLEIHGTEHGTHFDFSSLIGAYEMLGQNWDNWDYNQCKIHWIKRVGGKQLLAPAHVANEYSRQDRPFYPLPDFTQGGLPRERGYNGQDWYAKELGKEWSWSRAGHPTACSYHAHWLLSMKETLCSWKDGRGATDAVALQQLVTTREQQLQILKTELKKVIKEQKKLKPRVEQVEKSNAEEAEKRCAAEERKDDGDKTEGRIKAYSPLYKPAAAPAWYELWKSADKTPKQVAKFLRLVAEGEQNKAEAMLRANSNLALQSGTVTDLSKRTFKHITAFQYAVWARDWHMWMMLLKYLPEEEAALQFHSLETNGTEHGTQFDFGILIGAYQTLDQNWWDYNQRDTHWVKQIGGAQLLVPAHVANEYSRSDRPFYPLPDFTQKGLPRERGHKGQEWYDFSCLGSEWAWARDTGPRVGYTARSAGVVENTLLKTRVAVQQLVTTREQQLQSLKAALYQKNPHLRAKVV